jgi:hypothetical protein
LEQIDEDLTKIRTSNAKANESILALDLKAATKELALNASHSNDEHLEMEAIKVKISEMTAQKEHYLAKIQVSISACADF